MKTNGFINLGITNVSIVTQRGVENDPSLSSFKIYARSEFRHCHPGYMLRNYSRESFIFSIYSR